MCKAKFGINFYTARIRKSSNNYAEYIYLRELMDRNINTYIIGHYNPSVRIIDLVSHTTYVKCVNFRHKWRALQFKVDSERQFFEKLFMEISFTLRVFARLSY